MNNTKQLSRLMVFAAVAKKGSFTQAAKQLGVSKSAVSQQVKLLEKELGISVLKRTTRGVSLTALGEKLLINCQLLHDQVDMIFNDISDAGINPKGQFAVTFPHSLETTVVIPAIEQLCAEYTGLEPKLIVSDQTMDLVSNDLDVAVHAGELPDSSYRALPVGTMTEIFCATPLYLNRTPTIKNPDDLCNHSWISTSWQHQNMSIYRKKDNHKLDLTLTQFAQVNTLPSALEMALRHMGIVLLPDVVSSPLIKSGELVQILEGFTGPKWPIYTIHAYQKEKPKHITRFQQLISRSFGSL